MHVKGENGDLASLHFTGQQQGAAIRLDQGLRPGCLHRQPALDADVVEIDVARARITGRQSDALRVFLLFAQAEEHVAPLRMDEE